MGGVGTKCCGQTTTHDKLAAELDDVIEEPAKIKLNVAKGLVESCYEPIVQSGGEYDLKVRSSSSSSTVIYLTADKKSAKMWR